MKIDLQLHSTYSDGYLTPTELAGFLSSQQVKVASLTDHNTVSGWGEFRQACKQYKIKAIPGLELYAKFGSKRLNLLWYNFDPAYPGLHDLLRATQVRRRQRVRNILNKLVARGYQMDVNKTLDKYNHYVPINHVIDDIVSQSRNLKRIKKELNSTAPREEDMIRRLFYKKEIGILHESNINADKIFSLRKKIGGQIVYCHPAKHNMPKFELLARLKKAGLDGIELLSPHHTYGAVMFLQEAAAKLDFITTGGSDFHLHEGGRSRLQNSGQYFQIESGLLNEINKIIS
jgi:hypothetical protein